MKRRGACRERAVVRARVGARARLERRKKNKHAETRGAVGADVEVVALFRAVHDARGPLASPMFAVAARACASRRACTLRRATCRSVSSSWFAARSHDEAAVRRGDPSWHILTPIISDQVSIPDGVVGDVAEIGCEVGDVVEEGHVAVIIETHKACLNVKATGARTMRVVEILASVGDEVKESDPLVLVERAPE